MKEAASKSDDQKAKGSYVDAFYNNGKDVVGELEGVVREKCREHVAVREEVRVGKKEAARDNVETESDDCIAENVVASSSCVVQHRIKLYAPHVRTRAPIHVYPRNPHLQTPFLDLKTHASGRMRKGRRETVVTQPKS
ncbi:hypothetical protein VNO78_11280 [Psophocarpus tetragonolobus]|uniref:Uncharacterized protein n=1 Tax=Psophocarpus tetragonolobus TaxID=3891 RepID=A0AAN9SNN2_PSOTE